MKRVSGSVTYSDGRVESFDAGTAIHRKWESYALRHGIPATPDRDHLDRFPVYTWRLYIAWAALGIEEGFDVWVETVDEVSEADDDEAAEVPPTLREASPER